MKPIAIFAATFAAAAASADPESTNEIVLRGVLDLGDTTTFSLTSPGGQSKDWVKPGDSFMDFEIVRYDPESKLLTVTKDGAEYQVGLDGVQETKGDSLKEARAEAADMIKKVRFRETLSKMMTAQRGAMAETMRQQAAQAGLNDPELLAFQEKAMAEMFDEIDWGKIEDGMVDVYAQVFTPAELRGISDFYSTPAGQASIEKAPQLQGEMMKILMPEIMASSQNMQSKMQTFLQERQQRNQPQPSE